MISPFIAVLAAYGFANHLLIIGTLAILLSGFLDVVDGAVARYHNKTSKFGAFLDSTMDRFADAIIYIGIIFEDTVTGLSVFWPYIQQLQSVMLELEQSPRELNVKLE